MINDDKLPTNMGIQVPKLGVSWWPPAAYQCDKAFNPGMKNSGENHIVWDNGLGPDRPD